MKFLEILTGQISNKFKNKRCKIIHIGINAFDIAIENKNREILKYLVSETEF